MTLGTATLLLQVLASSPDTAAIMRQAHGAQTRFESIRRALLPRERRSWSSERCDARIGRFCYWYDSTEAPAPPEQQRLRDERARLLATLDSAARAAPQDAWVAGQRIRYLLESGLPADAVDAASRCRAEASWCPALLGLSLHVSTRYADADAAFARALAAMPARERCEWYDLRDVVSPALGSQFDTDACEARVALAERLWQLAQPLWSLRSGNDARTEHFARLTMARILSQASNPQGANWSWDSRELLVRYGWSEWYARQDPSDISGWPSITGHDREPSFHFFPDMERVGDRIADSTWRLRDPFARSRYAPRHITALSDLPHQLSRFIRGDSVELVATFVVDDSGLANDSTSSEIDAIARGNMIFGSPGISSGKARGIAHLVVPNDTVVASIEIRGLSTKRAARARYTVDPLPCQPGRCISDIVLYATPDTTLEQRDAVLALALDRHRASATRPLGVYWEADGLAGVTPWISLAIEPRNVGAFRRLATRLHLARAPASVRMRWRSAIQDAHATQSVHVGLPPAARGAYRVVLTIETPGEAFTRTRDIELTP